MCVCVCVCDKVVRCINREEVEKATTFCRHTSISVLTYFIRLLEYTICYTAVFDMGLNSDKNTCVLLNC